MKGYTEQDTVSKIQEAHHRFSNQGLWRATEHSASEQHGFHRGHCCKSQLLEFADDTSEAMKRGCLVDVVIKDFSKAFDRVCHNLLIHKVCHSEYQGRLTSGQSISWPTGVCSSGRIKIRVHFSGIRCSPSFSHVTYTVHAVHQWSAWRPCIQSMSICWQLDLLEWCDWWNRPVPTAAGSEQTCHLGKKWKMSFHPQKAINLTMSPLTNILVWRSPVTCDGTNTSPNLPAGQTEPRVLSGEIYASGTTRQKVAAYSSSETPPGVR